VEGVAQVVNEHVDEGAKRLVPRVEVIIITVHVGASIRLALWRAPTIVLPIEAKLTDGFATVDPIPLWRKN
jgi:hypothetical protein